MFRPLSRSRAFRSKRHAAGTSPAHKWRSFQNSTFDLLIIYNAEVLILEKDITIDKDEHEQEIEFNFDVEKIRDEEIDGKLEIFCRIIYKDSDIATKIDSMIVVRTERGRR